MVRRVEESMIQEWQLEVLKERVRLLDKTLAEDNASEARDHLNKMLELTLLMQGSVLIEIGRRAKNEYGNCRTAG